MSLLEKEYEFLSKQAQKQGLTIPLLIKQKVLPREDFNKLLDQLKELVKNEEAGKVFTIRDLFKSQWSCT